MTGLKTTFTVNYTTIVNLQRRLRDIAAQFAAPTSRIQIQNVNQPAERIILIFADERFVIDCDWNRIRFRGQGQRADYRKTEGSLRFFFQILEEIEAFDGFGEYEKEELSCYDRIESDEIGITGVAEFSDRYLQKTVTDSFGDAKDYAVTVSESEGDCLRTLRWGPFQHRDIENFNLKIFEGGDVPGLEETEGTLAHVTVSAEEVEAAHRLFVRLDDHRKSLLERLTKT